MRTRTLQRLRVTTLLAVAIVVTAQLAAAQTLTLGFDGAHSAPLPWSEQGFSFDTPTGNAYIVDTLPATAPTLLQQGFGVGFVTTVELTRDGGGTFDAVSLDVLVSLCEGFELPLCDFRVSSDLHPEGMELPPNGTLAFNGPEWVGITSLTITISGLSDSNAVYLVTDNFVVNVPATECLLVIGDAPGSSTYFDIDHLFQTQLDGVEDAHAVWLDDTPEFVLPVRPGRRHVTTATPMTNATIAPSLLGDDPPGQPPTWMLDGDFAVQVLMWNPELFPGQPEQFTAGLYISIQPDGNVLAVPFGADQGGLQLWHEIDTDANGQSVIRFPFSIPGFEP